jgi:hypothetical protein
MPLPLYAHGKEPLIPIQYDDVWVSEPVRMFLGNEKSLYPFKSNFLELLVL